ncbi:MAG: DUF3108 domain-containing protein [Pseudomonadota bacterium]
MTSDSTCVTSSGSVSKLMGAAGIALVSAVGFAGVASAQAPTKVKAHYDVTFSGVTIGRFNYVSSFDGRRYRIDADAKARLLLGALSWKGNIDASGRVVDGQPVPTAFSQEFRSKRKLFLKTKKKTKAAKLTFRRGNLVDADLQPPRKTHNRAPLRPKHTRGVLDPASAVVALTMPQKRGDPCRRRLKVFDGRMRFDLRVSQKRKQNLTLNDGRQVRAIVCGVKYVPIAGHKLKDDGNKRLQRPGAIEFSLRPVAGGTLYVPHEVRVKTGAGTARLTARRVDITMRGRDPIALTN